MYNLKKDIEGKVNLYEDNIKVISLDVGDSISVEYILNFKLYKKSYTLLSDFLKEISDTEDLSKLNINLYKNNIKYNLEFDKTSDTSEKSINLNILYIKELYKFEQGLSNYDYVKDYLPVWSTAYKTIYSNHTKTFEPLFTNALNIKYNVDNFISDLPIQSIKNVIFYKRSEIKKTIPDKTKSTLISRQSYQFNSDVVLNFGHTFTKVYVELSEDALCKIRIKGLYKNSLIKEDIILTDRGIVTLKNEYNKIYSIDLIDFYGNLIPALEVKVSNILYIDSFNTESSPERLIQTTDTKLLLKQNGVTKYIFNNTIPNHQGLYIDNKDNLMTVYNNILYTAKLNIKIDMDIPSNLTYNNTSYIETTYLNSEEYEIALDVVNFIKDVESDRCCVSITNSNNEKYYLNSNYELQQSEEDIFISIKDSDEKIYITLELDSAVEYVIISLKDSNSFYIKSNIILQPFVEYIPNLKIENNEKLVKLNNKYFLLDIENNNLSELEISPSQISLNPFNENPLNLPQNEILDNSNTDIAQI